MKRIFLFLFAALSMIVLTTACSKSDDGFNPNDQKKDETQFDFEFRGEFCKTWIDKDNHRAYCCKEDENDYYGCGKFTNDFDYFINEFDKFRPVR